MGDFDAVKSMADSDCGRFELKVASKSALFSSCYHYPYFAPGMHLAH